MAAIVAIRDPRVSALPGSAKDWGVPRFDPFRGVRYAADRCDPAGSPPRPTTSSTTVTGPRWPPPTRPTSWSSTCRWRRRRPLRHGAATTLRPVAGRRRPGPRRAAVVLRLPHELPRRDRRPAPHHRRDGRARAEPARRGRHPPPRAHHPEGQERPAQPPARPPTPTCRRSGASPPPPASPTLLEVDEPPIASWTDDAGVDPRPLDRRRPGARRRPSAAAIARPAGGHRRRPPPLRDLAGLPGRAARRGPVRRRGARAPRRCSPSWSSWSTTSSTVLPIHRLISGLPDDFDLPRPPWVRLFEIGSTRSTTSTPTWPTGWPPTARWSW